VSRPRRFAPSPALTLATLLLVALFVRLGLWQWQRGVQRQAQWQDFARGADQLVPLGARAPQAVPLFQRVSVSGRLDGAHQFLLDNRSHRGVAGYEVLTPLLRSGSAVLLVDRGWLPFGGSRARLPEIALDAPAVESLTGRIADLPSPGLASGRVGPDAGAPWPKLTSFPSARELGAALGTALPERILLLDPGTPHGYLRDWQPPGMTPLRHFSYAIQWWTFAAVALIVWALMSARRPTPPAR
jgi:surfeit locus 1 family protein